MTNASRQLLEDQIRAACVLEATARKPGNVHPQHSFADLTFNDFVVSAEAAAPVLARTAELGVGRAILDAVTATQARVGRNTNLGIILLLAPLAAVPAERRLADGIAGILAGLTRQDAELVYEAIRLAHPGGLGRVDNQDIGTSPTLTLLEVMRLATDRDLIARQYADNFSIVLEIGLPYFSAVADFERHWEAAIIGLQLELLARHADSLIVRKCGREMAEEASRRARAVLQAATPGTRNAQVEMEHFDRWLRAEGNRRNPGTTADLLAASLFAAMRDGNVPVMAAPTGLGPL
ncbi:MAG TPA: triphosphoribosyl-dephospho-CoA synthase [Planctomycetaceae bacterium]|jgi:triphosphoribosyl-dephospho-CoA synthase